MAWVMLKALRVSGSESLSVAANVFIGQTEAPLVVRPIYLQDDRIGAVHNDGGAVWPPLPVPFWQLISRCWAVPDEVQAIVLCPASTGGQRNGSAGTIVIAKLLKPEIEESLTKGSVHLEVEKTATNVIEAAANGAADGVRLSLNVGGMLLAFFALITMINFRWHGLGK